MLLLKILLYGLLLKNTSLYRAGDTDVALFVSVSIPISPLLHSVIRSGSCLRVSWKVGSSSAGNVFPCYFVADRAPDHPDGGSVGHQEKPVLLRVRFLVYWSPATPSFLQESVVSKFVTDVPFHLFLITGDPHQLARSEV